MYRLVIEGFQTKEQAEEFASWYEGQGEQDICYWLENAKDEGKIDVDSMNAELGGLKYEGNDIIMKIKPQ